VSGLAPPPTASTRTTHLHRVLRRRQSHAGGFKRGTGGPALALFSKHFTNGDVGASLSRHDGQQTG